ncbi:MAG: hypothetical protein R3C61_08765 [Bacteroidia bacterium]
MKKLITILLAAFFFLPPVSAQPYIQEQVEVHLDRDVYFTGEKIWMSLMVTDAAFNHPSPFSRVVYAELWGPSGSPVAQLRIPVNAGFASATLTLDPAFSTGYYQLRAYTRWMQNVSSDNFFHTTIAIVNPSEEIPVYDTLAGSPGDPLVVNIFPEGGHWVEGIESRAGILIKDKWGRGVETSGWLGDEKGQQEASFFTNDRGMGFFSVVPSSGSEQKLWVTKKDGTPQQIALPAPRRTGLVLRAEQTSPGEIRVELRSNFPQDTTVQVSVSRGGVNLAPVKIHIREGQGAISYPAGLFPRGKVEIRVESLSGEYVAGRNIWLTDIHPLMIGLSVSEKKITAGSPFSIRLETTDYHGKPLPAHISASISKVSPRPFGFSTETNSASDLDMLCSQPEVRPSSVPEILPELYGMLVSGTVKNLRYPEGARIYLSIPGKIPYVRFTRPQSSGKFYFQLEDRYGVGEIVVFGVDSAGNLLEITLDPVIAAGTPGLYSPSLSFSVEYANQLRQMYLHTQIQHAWLEENPASEPVTYPVLQPFFGKPERTYLLDNFTRFSIEETFIEIIYQVHVNHRLGKPYLRVYDQYADAMLEGEPLMLVDGIPFLNAEALLGINSRLVEQADVLSTRYYSDQTFFDGMVHLITYDGSGKNVKLPSEYIRQNYSYFTPAEKFVVASGRAEPHIPDYRSLIYWNPEIHTDTQGRTILECQASDVPGKYEVRVEALTSEGFRETLITYLEIVSP